LADFFGEMFCFGAPVPAAATSLVRTLAGIVEVSAMLLRLSGSFRGLGRAFPEPFGPTGGAELCLSVAWLRLMAWLRLEAWLELAVIEPESEAGLENQNHE
jgi:hypothetical protein